MRTRLSNPTGYEGLTPLEKIRKARETRPMDKEAIKQRLDAFKSDPACRGSGAQIKEDEEALRGME